MPTLLLSGANRGIGLEYARQYLGDGWRVHACCRFPDRAKDLKALEGDLHVHKMDVTDALQVANLARELREEPLDLLINNAGVYGARSGLGEQDFEAWAETLQINLLAPMRVVEAFLPLLEKSETPRIVNMSSRLGSIELNDGGGSYPYRTSKAALNMVTKNLSVDLAEKGVIVVSVHPGWVETDMGGSSAPVAVEDSVSGLRRLIASLEAEHSGRFFTFEGDELPW